MSGGLPPRIQAFAQPAGKPDRSPPRCRPASARTAVPPPRRATRTRLPAPCHATAQGPRRQGRRGGRSAPWRRPGSRSGPTEGLRAMTTGPGRWGNIIDATALHAGLVPPTWEPGRASRRMNPTRVGCSSRSPRKPRSNSCNRKPEPHRPSPSRGATLGGPAFGAGTSLRTRRLGVLHRPGSRHGPEQMIDLVLQPSEALFLRRDAVRTRSLRRR